MDNTCIISFPDPMFDHLLESSRRDDSNKWSNIGYETILTSGQTCIPVLRICYELSLEINNSLMNVEKSYLAKHWPAN